jgi:hypothetical protein
MAVICVCEVKAGAGGAEGAAAGRKGARIHWFVLVVYREAATVNAGVDAVCKRSGGGSEAVVLSHLPCACPSRRKARRSRSQKSPRDALRVACVAGVMGKERFST